MNRKWSNSLLLKETLMKSTLMIGGRALGLELCLKSMLLKKIRKTELIVRFFLKISAKKNKKLRIVMNKSISRTRLLLINIQMRLSKRKNMKMRTLAKA